MPPSLKVVLMLVLGMVCSSTALPLHRLQRQQDQAQFPWQVEVDAVLVDVLVTRGWAGRIDSSSLQAQHFKIFEDDAEQEIVYFSRDSVPLSVVVVLDIACSQPLGQLQQSALRVMSLLGPEDQMMLITADSQVRVVSDFELDRVQAARALSEIQPGDNRGTALHQAVTLALNRLKGRAERQILIVLSYLGRDLSSTGDYATSAEKSLDRLKQSDARVYSISFPHPSSAQSRLGWTGPEVAPFDPDRDPGPFRDDDPFEEEGVRYLMKLASISGGRFYKVTNQKEMEARLQEIAEELGSLYRLAFVPSNRDADKRYRTIKVKVTAPGGLHARSRKGYYYRGD